MSDEVIITPGDGPVVISSAATRSVTIAQGVAGPSGTPGLVWRGTWAGSTSYALNDVVYFNGTAWVASTAVGPDISPPLSGNLTSIYWEVVARGWPVELFVSSTAPVNPLLHDIWIQIPA